MPFRIKKVPKQILQSDEKSINEKMKKSICLSGFKIPSTTSHFDTSADDGVRGNSSLSISDFFRGRSTGIESQNDKGDNGIERNNSNCSDTAFNCLNWKQPSLRCPK
jgi:hypothetical protein